MNCFAAKRRQKVAQGVSPGKTYRGIEQPPEGAAEYVALSGLFAAINSDPGLTPWATVVDAASRLDWQTAQFVHSFTDRRFSTRPTRSTAHSMAALMPAGSAWPLPAIEKAVP